MPKAPPQNASQPTGEFTAVFSVIGSPAVVMVNFPLPASPQGRLPASPSLIAERPGALCFNLRSVVVAPIGIREWPRVRLVPVENAQAG